MDMINFLQEKSTYVKIETLKLHKVAQETRIASSLSPIEIFVSLYYGKILNYDPSDIYNEYRDRFIISKGHGSISMYPILADLGFFSKKELSKICSNGAFLGAIPDPLINGYETINGSLGHGIGVGSGMAVALKNKKKKENVVVLTGDGELNEGSSWEAIMFAAHHKLDNLMLIVDYNKVSMLDFSANIIDLSSLSDKFKAFNWHVSEIDDGNNLEQVYSTLKHMIYLRNGRPKAVIANTTKGKGVPFLETHPLSHVLSVKPEEIDKLIMELANER